MNGFGRADAIQALAACGGRIMKVRFAAGAAAAGAAAAGAAAASSAASAQGMPWLGRPALSCREQWAYLNTL